MARQVVERGGTVIHGTRTNVEFTWADARVHAEDHKLASTKIDLPDLFRLSYAKTFENTAFTVLWDRPELRHGAVCVEQSGRGHDQ